MTRTDRFPVSSFGAELQSVLREGANRELRLKFDSDKLATRFAQRINALRAAMRREKHPDWEQLYRCGVHKDETDSSILILAPRDSEFRHVLKEAGIDTPAEPPPRSEYKIDQPPAGEPLNADSFLATLRDQTTIPPREKRPKLDEL